ncbi:MAG: ATP-dependent RecD-like DNA helicase [Clostridia bacterium]|nr:ATP-dependent RecD-like DNA helicase [Clostridia bacterium]
MQTLKGRVTRLVYRNEQNGYTVVYLNTPEGERTVVGTLPYLNAGEEIMVQGDWAEHPDYGSQFSAQSAQQILPTKKEGIEAYLAGPLFPGLGPRTAALITGFFGAETLDVLSNKPQRLTEVPGIGTKKAKTILETYQTHVAARETMLYLQGNGFSANMAMRVYKKYGAGAQAVVQQNPYRLVADIQGVGFKTADALAQSIGIAADDAFRVQAGVLFAMDNAGLNGHTCLPRTELVRETVQLLHVQAHLCEAAIDELIERRMLEPAESLLSLPYMLHAEKAIARRIKTLTGMSFPLPASFDESIENAEGNDLTINQINAIRLAAGGGITVITGGPGTGKTTLIKTLCLTYEKRKKKVLLAAPTGRAAKRMEDACGRTAATLHRLLEYAPTDEESGRMAFSRNPDNPLICDVLIIDETSMLDTMLLHHTLAALPAHAQLVMVGDADQLPPVGAGQALWDIIESRAVPVIELKEIFRQGAGSLIIQNAHGILADRPMTLNKPDGDCFIDRRQTPEQVAAAVVALCKTRLPDKYGYSINDGTLQALAPQRKGRAGVNELNLALQAALNPQQEGAPFFKMPWGGNLFVGDRVLQTRNDYQMSWDGQNGASGQGVFNGDIGRVTDIDMTAKILKVEMEDGRQCAYDQTAISDLELAYCLSVHKSQGSEYPGVVVALSDGYSGLLTRNLLYTAMTRARRLCVFVGRDDTLHRMAHNKQTDKRVTGLVRWLQN